MIGDVFILKFNKFFIWVVLIVGVITIDFNYLQKDVEASSPISTFLVSTRPKEYNKFKENFEIIPLSESLSKETYDRFKKINQELSDKDINTQYRILTIVGDVDNISENEEFLLKYIDEISMETGSSKYSEENNISFFIFKDLEYTYVSGNGFISQEIIKNGLSFNIFKDNYVPDYSKNNIFDELTNKFLDIASSSEVVGILGNLVFENDEEVNNYNDDTNDFEVMNILIFPFSILLILSLFIFVLIYKIKSNNNLNEIDESNELKKVYDKNIKNSKYPKDTVDKISELSELLKLIKNNKSVNYTDNSTNFKDEYGVFSEDSQNFSKIKDEKILDNSIKLNDKNSTEFFKTLNNRSLLPEGFKEYMFEKYKNEDTENMGYFDILNTIDSELREFEKRM